MRALARTPVDIRLIDRQNHHTFQPLLYQVATAGLAAPSIAAPLRQILRGQANVTVRLGEVERIAPDQEQVIVDGRAVSYYYLLLSTGVELAGTLAAIARHTLKA